MDPLNSHRKELLHVQTAYASQQASSTARTFRTSRWAAKFLVLCCCLSPLRPTSLGAQGFQPNGSGVTPILMLAPREYQQRLRVAEGAIEREEYSVAIQQLASLLTPGDAALAQNPEEMIAEDYFLGHPTDIHLQSSLRGEARRLLGTLPARGQELYELEYGAAAERLLMEAVEKHDVELLAEVGWRYFHTKAGYQACFLLARHHLDRGRPLAASIALQRLHQAEAARSRFEPELSLLLAVSWSLSGEPERADDVLRELQQRRPNARFVIGGQDVTLFAAGESPREWLNAYVDASPIGSLQVAKDWRMHRGVPSRNASSLGGHPLTHPRWVLPVANNPDDEELARQTELDYQEEQVPPIPVIVPLAVADVVMLRTTEHLLAVDLASGKRIWEYPWARRIEDLLDDEENGSPSPQQRKNQVEERLWMDAIHGQVSSDGKHVFLIDELSYVGPATLDPTEQMMRNLRSRQVDEANVSNYLLALDIGSQGKYRWRVGGTSGEDEPRLANAFFLGPPLVLSGDLYVMGEIRGDISLFVLDAETGKLRWTQQLAHVGDFNIGIDSIRRLSGASPTYSDGVLICPTSAGAIVAVDIATRSLLWGHQYPRPISTVRSGFRLNINPALLRANTRSRWLDSTAIVGDGHAVITPPEIDEMICLDLLNGKAQWTIDRQDDLLFVACIHQEHAIVVGKSALHAYRLDDGQEAWQVAYQPASSAPAEFPSGRGFLSGDRYFLPTTRHLVEIDLANHQVVDARLTDTPLGNLVCFGDQLVSLSPTELAAYHLVQPLEEEVTQRLAQNAKDPWALEHAGLLALERGELDLALSRFRDAFQAYEEAADRRIGTRMLLVDAMLAKLQQDPEADQALVDEVATLINRPVQRERFLQIYGRRMLRTNRPLEAFQTFMELARQQQTPSVQFNYESTSLPLLQQSNSPHYIRRDRQVRAGIEAALAQADAAQRQEMERSIAEEIEKVRGSRISQQIELLNFFGPHPLLDPMRLELAARFIDGNRLLEAEQLLMPIVESSSRPAAGQAWLLMAKLYDEAGRDEAWAQCIAKLDQDWSNELLEDGKTGAEWATVLREGSNANVKAGLLSWPYGRVEVENLKVSPNTLPPQFQAYSNYYPVHFRGHTGPLSTSFRVAYDHTGTNAIMVQDALGREQLRIGGANTAGRNQLFVDGTLTSKTLGHLVLINHGHGLVAIDATRVDASPDQSIRWPSNYSDVLAASVGSPNTMQAIAKTNEWGATQYVISGRRVDTIGPVRHDGLIYLQGNSLQCVEPLSGETIWSRKDVFDNSVLWGDDQYVLVWAEGEQTARVFRRLDGEELAPCAVPDPERTWTQVGRCVLTWDRQIDGDSKRWRLRLFDPLEQNDRWMADFTAESKADLSPDHELLVVQPDGLTTILDVRSGAKLLEVSLKPTDRPLSTVHLMGSQDQFLVVRSSSPKAPEGMQISSFPDPSYSPLIDGDVHAFLRATGQAQWQTGAVIENYGLPLDQPPEAPILAFVRNVRRTDSGTRRRRGQLEMICLDKRDGRIVLDVDKLAASYGSFFMSANPDDNTVAVRLLNANNYEFRLTNQPQPPAPPAQTGTAASRDKGAGLSDIMGAVFDALGRGLRGDGEDQADQAEDED